MTPINLVGLPRKKKIVLSKNSDKIGMDYASRLISSMHALIKAVLSCPLVDNTSVHT